jgi:hypothetical protein
VPAMITLSIRLGPLVSLKITGQSCEELAHALRGSEDLNARVDAMCGSLASMIYPEGADLNAIRDEIEEEFEEAEREEEK